MLDRADELQGKHTLFGRVIGDTIYSTRSESSSQQCLNSSLDVMKIGELELGEDERPV
jgi:peptidyl-prolyl cis-trans isomerase SDCCAG10